MLLIPLNPRRSQHLILLTVKLLSHFILIMRIKEMIANLGSFNCNPTLLASTKGNVYKGMENMHTDIRV